MWPSNFLLGGNLGCKLFIKNITRINSSDGSKSKIFFLFQLIYMCQNKGKTMYNDEFNAFEHGMVLEKVRLEYQNSFETLYNESKSEISLPEDVLKALVLTKEIFGNCSANELPSSNGEINFKNCPSCIFNILHLPLCLI